jgi:hypothetical protein
LPIQIQVSDAPLTSDAGLLPLRQFDQRIGLTQQFAAALDDPRDGDLIEHSFTDMVRMRIFAILAGYQDQNDHDMLCTDPVFKLIAERSPTDADLASRPTLSRFENQINIASLKRLRQVFVDQFIASFAEPPLSLTFDLDAVDDPAHGSQQLTLFHAFYEPYQYLPLVITSAETEQVVMVNNRNKELKCGLEMDRLSDHRFLANYFRLYLHAAALNLLVRLRREIASLPPAPEGDVPVEALASETRKQYQNASRRENPLGRGQLTTWRLLLMNVAASVVVSCRRIVARFSGTWPNRAFFEQISQHVSRRPAGAGCWTG